MTITTTTHIFTIDPYWTGDAGYLVEYRAINPKTGRPWQSHKRVTIGATIEPAGWAGRPITYATIEAAQAAVDIQIAKLAKRGGF